MRTIDLLMLIDKYYTSHNNDLRNLHTVIEDKNTEKVIVLGSAESCDRLGDREGAEILERMARMPKSQRDRVVEYFWWARQLKE